jgi:hypothetical protein
MKAVWSFWTKPLDGQRGSGWTSEKHHWLAWIPSVETARQHYSETCLYTDDEGAKILVDGLDLSFTQVLAILNALNHHDPGWWTLGKVYTYALQTEPFIHIDSDVFPWKRLPTNLEYADVLAQNPEYFTPGASFYQPERFEQTLSYFAQGGWLPEEWLWYRQSARPQRGECCGIFGGARTDFIRHYAGQALRLVEHPSNQPGWRNFADKTSGMLLIEQYMLSACLEYHRARPASPFANIGIQYLFNSVEEAFDTQYARRVGYTHLIADSKKKAALAQRLERRVQRDYPDQYERCCRFIARRR